MNVTQIAFSLLLAMGPVSAASLTHDYQFQGNLADTLGGRACPLSEEQLGQEVIQRQLLDLHEFRVRCHHRVQEDSRL
jgi:hypothetical protein